MNGYKHNKVSKTFVAHVKDWDGETQPNDGIHIILPSPKQGFEYHKVTGDFVGDHPHWDGQTQPANPDHAIAPYAPVMGCLQHKATLNNPDDALDVTWGEGDPDAASKRAAMAIKQNRAAINAEAQTRITALIPMDEPTTDINKIIIKEINLQARVCELQGVMIDHLIDAANPDITPAEQAEYNAIK
ncbi:MAG: hypothetical protein OEY11_15160, partial [Gammaproteobacteria bacterium]|nr:hypothetical protein [Gammaproteobacteria bacterium]